MAISRRTFVTAATALPFLPTASHAFTADAQGGTLLLHDPSLEAGKRFAAQAGRLGGQATALAGDRIRFMRALLASRPEAVYGVSRYSDMLLASEVAREAGYMPVALIQHRQDGTITPQCQPSALAIATVAGLAGSRWPETFAELALGGVQRCSAETGQGMPEPAMSWALARRR